MIDIKTIWLITNFVVITAIQQILHSKINTINLIIQCNKEPISPLAPISPTILNATLKAINPINVTIAELTK